jgi:hypothetical protein
VQAPALTNELACARFRGHLIGHRTIVRMPLAVPCQALTCATASADATRGDV